MVAIIGGGPIGAYTASILAKAGHKVEIFEEHKTIGKPLHCTGIVTNHITQIIKPKEEFVINKLNTAVVHAQNGQSVEVKVKELVIDREKFDRHLIEMALSEGAKLHLNQKYKGFNQEHIIFTNGKTVKKQVLIGADGPLSSVGKSIGITNKEFYYGIQAIVQKKVDPTTFHTFFGKDYPKFFGWIVPENNETCRIGLATKTNPQLYFNKFINKVAKNCKIITKYGGLIPLHNPKMQITKDNVYLVGDSAGMVKATTGGGLIPGLQGAETLANSIINNKDYTKQFHDKTGKNLRLHLRIRNVLNRFSDEDYNYLIKLANGKNVNELLNHSDRENPKNMIPKLLLKEPRFLYFLKNM